jgi:cell division protein FtsL
MLRLINTMLAVLTVVAAGALYRIKADTRRLEVDVVTKERHLDRLENDIAHLEAERAFLARPQRLEPAARALGLVPIAGERVEPTTKLPRP